MRIRVLAIDDEASILGMIRSVLPSQEFTVQGTRSGEDGLEMAARLQPDAILLDWNLGGRSGLEVCRLIRKGEHTRALPIIMLTVEDRTLKKVEALDAGADDYVTKPFVAEELVARIKAVLRRRGSGVVPSEVIKRGVLEIDPAGYRVRVNGSPVALSTTEFEILYLLASRQHRAMTREILLEHTCPDTTETRRTIDVHVLHIRQKLGKTAGAYIHTVHRIGYMFSADE